METSILIVGLLFGLFLFAFLCRLHQNKMPVFAIIKREYVRFYFPIVACIIISIVLSILLTILLNL